ncbi:hypothetical protein LFAB_00070 [Lactiplantibacillus fabifermentans T30PCM01]|uniref:Uncharacterized protein n=1 Tax=Lactiplantibacillus fabifermentans T30PCM01 TaxID=1400520 RepID=W6TAV9_9LACO|nr:hypothetical protein [Lactiplantibacillus fabifermentans]ETY75791.1 hypothetical protein LFAB_00070 [Lactiplantibacillus fabifermentans T30PCM01]
MEFLVIQLLGEQSVAVFVKFDVARALKALAQLDKDVQVMLIVATAVVIIVICITVMNVLD